MKWDAEELADVEELIRERMAHLLPESCGAAFEGETLPLQSRASMRFSPLSGGAVLTIEAAIDRKAECVNEEDAKYLLMDALDNLAFDWFEALKDGEEERVHGGWQKWAFQGHELDVRLEKNFPHLEAMADDLLESRPSKIS